MLKLSVNLLIILFIKIFILFSVINIYEISPYIFAKIDLFLVIINILFFIGYGEKGISSEINSIKIQFYLYNELIKLFILIIFAVLYSLHNNLIISLMIVILLINYIHFYFIEVFKWSVFSNRLIYSFIVVGFIQIFLILFYKIINLSSFFDYYFIYFYFFIPNIVAILLLHILLNKYYKIFNLNKSLNFTINSKNFIFLSNINQMIMSMIDRFLSGITNNILFEILSLSARYSWGFMSLWLPLYQFTYGRILLSKSISNRILFLIIISISLFQFLLVYLFEIIKLFIDYIKLFKSLEFILVNYQIIVFQLFGFIFINFAILLPSLYNIKRGRLLFLSSISSIFLSFFVFTVGFINLDFLLYFCGSIYFLLILLYFNIFLGFIFFFLQFLIYFFYFL